MTWNTTPRRNLQFLSARSMPADVRALVTTAAMYARRPPTFALRAQTKRPAGRARDHVTPLPLIKPATKPAVSAAVLVRIEVSPPLAALPEGTCVPLTAIGVYQDGSTVDLTNRVEWSTSDGHVAGVGRDGVAISIAPGVTVVGASMGAVTGTAEMEVVEAPLVSFRGRERRRHEDRRRRFRDRGEERDLKARARWARRVRRRIERRINDSSPHSEVRVTCAGRRSSFR
jgi:hypothetical protein